MKDMSGDYTWPNVNSILVGKPKMQSQMEAERSCRFKSRVPAGDPTQVSPPECLHCTCTVLTKLELKIQTSIFYR
ncbi:hypothetical protein AAFF_G00071630 [Aldrovandia affinis]|uniref:Uncharacterized protein n=1 Tax=Aldrovandia affinis TaxID=143900 RepID=A0AAD7RZ36_9TELE|nr:hypothetical protein AAFF_G00071630 [Aldrovandia affinis]